MSVPYILYKLLCQSHENEITEWNRKNGSTMNWENNVTSYVRQILHSVWVPFRTVPKNVQFVLVQKYLTLSWVGGWVLVAISDAGKQNVKTVKKVLVKPFHELPRQNVTQKCI